MGEKASYIFERIGAGFVMNKVNHYDIDESTRQAMSKDEAIRYINRLADRLAEDLDNTFNGRSFKLNIDWDWVPE